ncbi:MAG: hypothetical protein KDC48_14265, partial [Planctomycetes bacterium]|nr:hypothetical protein [Planctomycetota bacterium]
LAFDVLKTAMKRWTVKRYIANYEAMLGAVQQGKAAKKAAKKAPAKKAAPKKAAKAVRAKKTAKK